MMYQDGDLALFAGLGKRFSRVRGFSGSQTDEFGPGIGKCSIDKDRTKPLEAITECTRIVPVVSTDVASGVGWHTAAIGDDTKDDEANDGNNFD